MRSTKWRKLGRLGDADDDRPPRRLVGHQSPRQVSVSQPDHGPAGQRPTRCPSTERKQFRRPCDVPGDSAVTHIDGTLCGESTRYTVTFWAIRLIWPLKGRQTTHIDCGSPFRRSTNPNPKHNHTNSSPDSNRKRRNSGFTEWCARLIKLCPAGRLVCDTTPSSIPRHNSDFTA